MSPWKLEDLPASARRQVEEKLRQVGTVRTVSRETPDEKPIEAPKKKVTRVRKRSVDQGQKTPGLVKLLADMRANSLPEPEREWRFHSTRRWRFDLAFVHQRIAVEIEGGVWSGGRHVRGHGYERDAEKYNEAQIMGWTVLRYSTGMVERGEVIADLLRVLGRKNG